MTRAWTLKRPYRPPTVVEWDGKQVRLADLCRRYKIARTTIDRRLVAGWTLKQALLTPRRCCHVCFEQGRITKQ